MTAQSYYDAPQGFMSAAIHATSAWPRLKQVWFQKERYEGEGLEEKELQFEVRSLPQHMRH